MAKPIDQKVQGAVKSVIQKVILNISIIAIFVALAVIALAYAGLNFDLSTGIVWKVAVPSIVLAISSIIIYELWLKNGAESARNEKEYQDLVKTYDLKSKNLNDDVLQEALDAEKERRYKVEEYKLEQLIEKLQKSISTADNKRRVKYLKKKLNHAIKQKDRIVVVLPFSRSEQFDELRYTTKSDKFKEYKPNDTRIYLRGQRTKKYISILTTTLVGLNAITVSAGASNILVAVFMTVLAAISLLMSLIFGFSAGYTSISVSSTGIYRTALSFIDKAQAYCLKYNKNLYYTIKEPIDDIPELLENVVKTQEEFDQELEDKLFARAELEVTKQDKMRI